MINITIMPRIFTILLLIPQCMARIPIKCPRECSCSLDEKGQYQVLCFRGGILDPLPVLDMPSETEILIVSAPEEKENRISLGPLFRGLKNLMEIHVTNSQVPLLGEHSFWGLRKLTVLNVSHNSITRLLPNNFKGPEALESLDLSHNKIESVPSAVFRYLKNLMVLDLSNNRMPELAPKIFYGLSHLRELDLSRNPMGNLAFDRFIDVPLLTKFSCSDCGLLTISSYIFSELRNLDYLDLSENRFVIIPTIKISSQLIFLNLNGNHISKIRKGDFKGIQLLELQISHNRITEIEEGTFENSTLKILNLSYNRLSHLDSNPLGPILNSLKLLDFSGNSLHIEQLYEILPRARQLRSLGIGDLGLTRLPTDLLKRSRYLKHLNVSSNYLSRFPHQLLYSTPQLQSLDLSSNSFRGLNQNIVSAFMSMHSLFSVKLERNPWQCEECQVTYLIKWLKSSTKQPNSISACLKNPNGAECLKCVGPKKNAGKAMLPLDDQLGECTSVANSLWPYWESENGVIVQSDEPQTSDAFAEDPEKSNIQTVVAFFKDHIALLVGVACGLVLSMMLVIVTALICSRRQSAYYYTREDVEKSQKLMGRNNNESPTSSPPNNTQDISVIPPYEPMAISIVHSKNPIRHNPNSLSRSSLQTPKRPSIATIDEIASIEV